MFGFGDDKQKPTGLRVFSLWDSAANAYMTPFYLPAAGLAIRQLQDAMQKPDTVLHSHPEHFTLYELGFFEPATGIHTLHQGPQSIVTLAELKDRA